MKVAELRDELRARGLATTGLKAELEGRLEQARQAEEDDGEAQQQDEEEDDDEDDEEEVEDAEHWEDEDDEDTEDEDAVIIPMLGQELVTVSATVGADERGFQDGAAAKAMFGEVAAMLHLPDGRVLVADQSNHRIRMLSSDLQQVRTVAGDGESGHRDGAAAQARFNQPVGFALLPGGRVLVADWCNHRIRMLSADLQHVSTVAGDGESGHRDGAAAQAQFAYPMGPALLPDGRVLVADFSNHRIRMLSADLQHVSTVAGDGASGYPDARDGAAAQARFCMPSGFAVLAGGRVLVAGNASNRIRLLSADLQQVSTVAGESEEGHRDGAAVQAQFNMPDSLALLPDGRVLVADSMNRCIRVLSADLQDVSTLTIEGVNFPGCLVPGCFELLPDGRVLTSGWFRYIHVLEGLVALGAKPSYKPPKKTSQQQKKEKKRALAGGASSSGLVSKRSRSGASSSMAAPSSSDSEGEEQPGGSAAEAEPLV